MTILTPTRALLLFATIAAAAQTTSSITTTVPNPAAKAKPRGPKVARSEAPSYNTNMIVLDPAHGGADHGATLGENSFEKDANIAFAELLKPRLEAKGFTVVLTHPAATDDMTADARVEVANRSRAVACLLLHTSNDGHGVHLYTSALSTSHPSPISDDAKEILPWDTAQASILPQSIRLSSDLATAINGIRVPLVVGQTSVKPMDSLTCPVVALELAPLPGNAPASASDPAYQARIADVVAQALVFWRDHAISLASATVTVKATEQPTPSTEIPKPIPKPKPKPVAPSVKIPDEEPLVDTPVTPRAKAAPIVRSAPNVPATPPNGTGR